LDRVVAQLVSGIAMMMVGPTLAVLLPDQQPTLSRSAVSALRLAVIQVAS
jgi:hypothetical protein